MSQTSALETEIDSLKERAQTPEVTAAIDAKVKQLSKVKLIKPFEYTHQGISLEMVINDRLIGVYRK
jgi:hypothetical protein